MVDCVYIAAGPHDSRYTRICLASVRYFYPEIPIKLLIGNFLERAVIAEARRYWGVEVAQIPVRNWGWGFVKLEPLFGRHGERFLVLDSDTVLCGPILDDITTSEADFVVDDELQTEEDTKRLYYDWEEVAKADPSARRPEFVFNTGQWFGTAGVLSRGDFEPFIDWTGEPPRLRRPNLFMPGEQGVLNYVINKQARLKHITVARHKLMRWSGHGLNDLTVSDVTRQTVPSVVIHWAGEKGYCISSLAGADILRFFERVYYSRVSAGAIRQLSGTIRYPLAAWSRRLGTRIHMRLSKARVLYS